MGINAQYLFLKVLMESAHNRQDHKKGHNAECNAGYGNKRIKRDTPVAFFRFQVPECYAERVRTFHFSGLSCGNIITSLIEGESVKSMTSLSIPIPSPAAGGIPYSSARI